MPLEKVNGKGEFTYFPGVTVISSILEKDHEIWQSVYNSLNEIELIKNNFALLPSDSYHFTSIYLFNNRDGDDEQWLEFIESRSQLFADLSEAMKSKYLSKPEYSFKSVITEGVIQISLTPTNNSYHEFIKAVAIELGLENRVPHEFHVTLAYQYKYISREDMQQIQAMLHDKFSKILNTKMGFHSPQLCYFKDMTKFIPWDRDISVFVNDQVSTSNMKL